jgi:hypothetical protein
MRKLLDSARTPEHEARYRRLVKEVNHRHGTRGEKLQQITDLAQLKDFIRAEIAEMFSPRLLTFEMENTLAQAREAALTETRTIYIPKKGASNLFVSGQLPAETTEVFEVKAEAFEVNTSSLPPGCASALVLPLVASIPPKQPLNQYPRVGAIILGSDKIEGFDPQTDLRALRMIANDLANTLARLQKTL